MHLPYIADAVPKVDPGECNHDERHREKQKSADHAKPLLRGMLADKANVCNGWKADATG
jgi:hypothetical protein